MSYIPNDQLLSDSLDDLVRAMDDVSKRMSARIDDGEWSDGHVQELTELLIEFSKIRSRLRKLQRSTH